jgi:lysophospholipase L1-like esterase
MVCPIYQHFLKKLQNSRQRRSMKLCLNCRFLIERECIILEQSIALMKFPVYLLSLGLLMLTAAVQRVKPITVYLIGDSTIANKATTAFPETGWGMPFKHFFDSSVTVDNRAKNGRSTRTFLSENLWQPIADNLKEGDYVFIQFGHNDESKEKVDRYTSPETYQQNLTRFISETRERKAIPILLTPVSRRKFIDGKAVETHAEYTPLVIQVAKEQHVPLIDLDTKSRALYQSLGEEQSRLLFLHLQPGEHPNYPDGKEDNTHFSEAGARKIAQLILAEIKLQKLDLADRIVKPVKK